MDTVNNIAKAAANAVWGENTTAGSTTATTGTEPVSGQRGDTSIGEPYDKGNLEGMSASFTSFDYLYCAQRTDTSQSPTPLTTRPVSPPLATRRAVESEAHLSVASPLASLTDPQPTESLALLRAHTHRAPHLAACPPATTTPPDPHRPEFLAPMPQPSPENLTL